MPYLWLIKIAAIVALLGGTWWAGDRHGHRVEQQEAAEAREAARESVALVNKAQAFKAQEADHAQELTRARLVRSAAAARDELERLRNESASARDLPGSAENPGLAAYASTAAGLLATCADRYRDVADAAGSSSSRLGGLQRLVAPAPDQPASVSTP